MHQSCFKLRHVNGSQQPAPSPPTAHLCQLLLGPLQGSKEICHPTREHHDTDRAADLDQSEALSASTCGLGAAGAFRATLGFDQNEFSFSLGWAWFWETQGPAGEQGPFCVKHPKNHVKPNETPVLDLGTQPILSPCRAQGRRPHVRLPHLCLMGLMLLGGEDKENIQTWLVISTHWKDMSQWVQSSQVKVEHQVL